MVPLLIQWGQHRWLIGTGHAIAVMVVLTWTAAGFGIGLTARRLTADPGEAAAMALCAIGAGTFAIWLLMTVLPLQNYRGGDSSIPVAEGAEAITTAAAVLSLLVLAASAALARSSARSQRRSRMLTRATAVVAMALAASIPAAIETGRDAARTLDSFLTTGGVAMTTILTIDETVRPALEHVQVPASGPDPFAGYAPPAQQHVVFEPLSSTRITAITAPAGRTTAVDLSEAESPYTAHSAYSLPDGTDGAWVVDSVASPNGDVFAALCTHGAEHSLAGFLGYATVPWESGFCDGTVHVFTVHAVGTAGRQAQVTALGRFPGALFCTEPTPASPLAAASWVKTSGSSPCLDILAATWPRYLSQQTKFDDATRRATETRDAVVALTLLLAMATAPSITALRGRMRMPDRGRGTQGRTGRPTALDASRGWAAGLVTAAADALGDPGLTERFLEEWQADLAQFDKAWRRLLYALGVRLFAPRRLRAARNASAFDPETHR
jgi:hypothetical protein